MRAYLKLVVAAGVLMAACERGDVPSVDAAAPPVAAASVASNVPPLDATNIVSIASGSKDHTTLVTALKAADYVTSVAGSGPLTVFAPTNAAFDALPAGTVERLLEPANADELREILKYHVTTSALSAASLVDGRSLGMANGAQAAIRRDGDAISINGAKVVASITASNGMVHVIDAVLLPAPKP